MNYSKIIRAIRNPKVIVKKLINVLPLKLKNKLLKFPTSLIIEGELNQLRIKYEGSKIFVFPPPSSPWGYMLQRPQQLAKSLSAKGYPVIYCVDTNYFEDPDWSTRGLHRLEDNIYLFNDGLGHVSLKFLEKNIVFWQYWPHQSNYISLFSKSEVVKIYDCIDHVTTFNQYSEINFDHNISLKRADFVTVTAKLIYDEVKTYRQDCILLPNGVNLEDFIEIKQVDQMIARKLIELKRKNKKIIGYYGALAGWVDFQLIEKTAQNHEDWIFLLVGQKYPDIRIPNLDNIIIWERIDYKYINQLLQSFDVALIPFVLNDITLSTSPVKVFEYMAGGKPVVSSDLPEVRQLNPVLKYRNSTEFEEKILEALSLIKDSQYRQSLLYCAKEHTWSEKIDEVIDALRKRGVIVENTENSAY